MDFKGYPIWSGFFAMQAQVSHLWKQGAAQRSERPERVSHSKDSLNLRGSYSRGLQPMVNWNTVLVRIPFRVRDAAKHCANRMGSLKGVSA